MTYFGEEFQRGQRLFLSTLIWGHGLYLAFTDHFHSRNTGPWQKSNMEPKVILIGDLNGAMDNFLPSGCGDTFWDAKINGGTVSFSTFTAHFPVPYSHQY